MGAEANTTETLLARHGWRVARWSAAALALLAPAVAMQFDTGVNWSASDFLFAGAVMAGAGLLYELAALRTSLTYRMGVAAALLAAFLLIWVNAAVGFIGSEDNPQNGMYAAVLATALLGAVVARFRARGMAVAMAAAAAGQVLVPAIALSADFKVWIATVVFAGIWLIAAGLFRRAAG
jgi:hypothetical protein